MSPAAGAAPPGGWPTPLHFRLSGPACCAGSAVKWWRTPPASVIAQSFLHTGHSPLGRSARAMVASLLQQPLDDLVTVVALAVLGVDLVDVRQERLPAGDGPAGLRVHGADTGLAGVGRPAVDAVGGLALGIVVGVLAHLGLEGTHRLGGGLTAAGTLPRGVTLVLVRTRQAPDRVLGSLTDVPQRTAVQLRRLVRHVQPVRRTGQRPAPRPARLAHDAPDTGLLDPAAGRLGPFVIQPHVPSSVVVLTGTLPCLPAGEPAHLPSRAPDARHGGGT